MTWHRIRNNHRLSARTSRRRLRPCCARRRIPCQLLLPAQVSEEPEEHGEIHQTKMERPGEQSRRLSLFLAPISDGGAQIECALCDKQNGKIGPPDHHHTADKTNEKEQRSEPSEDSMREEAERQQAL